MKINKVVYGGATLLDLTEDTINEDVIVEGYVGHDARGEQITGNLKLITVDDELDANSANPVQNKVITEAIDSLLNDKLSTNEVGNIASKIPRFSSDGHLILPSGIELW